MRQEPREVQVTAATVGRNREALAPSPSVQTLLVATWPYNLHCMTACTHAVQVCM